MDIKDKLARPDDRLRVLMLSIIAAFALTIFLYLILHGFGLERGIHALLGLKKDDFYHPFTIQIPMWIVFCICLGELYLRYKFIRSETNQLHKNYLPEEYSTVLEARDLPKIVGNIKKQPKYDSYFLPLLIIRVCDQFQLSKSSDDAHSILSSNVDLFSHEIDLRYTFIRYVLWFIPTLGFIGTVYGIAAALAFAGSPDVDPTAPGFLQNVTAELAVAFYTTLLALIQAAVLVWLQNWLQSKEEILLNYSMQYCIDNLINRLYKRD